MVVITLERVKPSLRGELTRWLLEPRPGVFVGTVSAMVRDKLWERVSVNAGDGGGILVYDTNNEQGFSVRICGTPDREIADFEGLSLIRIPRKDG